MALGFYAVKYYSFPELVNKEEFFLKSLFLLYFSTFCCLGLVMKNFRLILEYIFIDSVHGISKIK